MKWALLTAAVLATAGAIVIPEVFGGSRGAPIDPVRISIPDDVAAERKAERIRERRQARRERERR